MFYVYVLHSIKRPTKYYVGFTKDLNKRVAAHNSGKSLFSRRYAPWQIECYIVFRDARKARRFERFLKSGSGHAFFRRHFV
ncbi:MAG: GIY-YIG nuclease family protein [Candidatus Omnitrophica bacterium]|nr:GIY-YIG nuclease family protein [Candidatus Omnitrophota bacterium]